MRRLARRSATNPPPDHPGPVRPGARDFPIDLSRRPALRLPAGVREADLAVAAEILAEPALELVDERPDHALLHRHAKLQLADAIVERIGAPDVLVDLVLLVHVPQDPHASNLRAWPGAGNLGRGARANTGSSGPRPILGRVLLRLHIDNLALIERADLEPAAGLNVLTGETGAGKTMLAEAIGLLAGAQPASGPVGPTARRRSWSPGGCSRAAAAGRSYGGGHARAATSRRWASGCSRSRRSTRPAAWPSPRASSSCSTAMRARRRWCRPWPRRGASGDRPRLRSRQRAPRRPNRPGTGST